MRRKFISLTLSAVLALGVTTPAWAATETYADGEVHTIGVVVYDPDASEMEMFSDYYRDYIQAGFPVKFIFSGKTTSAEDEIQYIERAGCRRNHFFCRFCSRNSGYHRGM